MREEAFEKHRIPCAALAYAPCFSNDGACRVTNPPGLLLNSLPCPQPQSSHWALPRPLLVSVDSFRFLWPFRPSLHRRAGCFTHPPENLLWILLDDSNLPGCQWSVGNVWGLFSPKPRTRGIDPGSEYVKILREGYSLWPKNTPPAPTPRKPYWIYLIFSNQLGC